MNEAQAKRIADTLSEPEQVQKFMEVVRTAKTSRDVLRGIHEFENQVALKLTLLNLTREEMTECLASTLVRTFLALQAHVDLPKLFELMKSAADEPEKPETEEPAS